MCKNFQHIWCGMKITTNQTPPSIHTNYSFFLSSCILWWTQVSWLHLDANYAIHFNNIAPFLVFVIFFLKNEWLRFKKEYCSVLVIWKWREYELSCCFMFVCILTYKCGWKWLVMGMLLAREVTGDFVLILSDLCFLGLKIP